MPRPKKISLTGSGAGVTYTNPYVLDWRGADAAVSLGFTTGGSTTGFTVQHCFDDTHLVPAASWTWFDHAELADMTAAADGNYAFPVTALRLKADDQGTDTGNLWIVQSGG